MEGRPSDQLPDVLALGDGDAAAVVLSMSARHPDGDDAAYLEWHLSDHLPEQHRLPGLRHGIRWVATPATRAARAAAVAPFDAVDHVVQYVLAPPADRVLDDWFALGRALREAGRLPRTLPSVHLGAYEVAGRRAAPRTGVGADVVPWRWSTGAYLVVEAAPVDGGAGLLDLVERTGVAGVWTSTGTDRLRPDRLASTAGTVLAVAHLDGDVLEAADALGDALHRRWADGRGGRPLLAAPLHTVVAPHWHRHLP